MSSNKCKHMHSKLSQKLLNGVMTEDKIITRKLCGVDIMLLIDTFPTPAYVMQSDKSGDARFPIVSFSAFP